MWHFRALASASWFCLHDLLIESNINPWTKWLLRFLWMFRVQIWETRLAWERSFCCSLRNKYCTATASLLMVSCVDHPSFQHSLFAVRTTSWLPINGAAASSCLHALPSLLCFTDSASSLLFLPFSPQITSLQSSIETPRAGPNSCGSLPWCTGHDFLKSI